MGAVLPRGIWLSSRFYFPLPFILSFGLSSMRKIAFALLPFLEKALSGGSP